MDPLAQLSDIHLPAPIAQYPIALGWWLLALLMIVLLVSAIVYLRRYKKLRQVKNIAIKQLQQNKDITVDEILLLIKWAALAYFPRQQCANLYGEKLQQFLLTTLPEKMPTKQRQQFKEQLTKCTSALEQVYRKNGGDIINNEVKQLALTWLNYALPPKITANHVITTSNKGDNAINNQRVKEDLS